MALSATSSINPNLNGGNGFASNESVTPSKLNHAATPAVTLTGKLSREQISDKIITYDQIQPNLFGTGLMPVEVTTGEGDESETHTEIRVVPDGETIEFNEDGQLQQKPEYFRPAYVALLQEKAVQASATVISHSGKNVVLSRNLAKVFDTDDLVTMTTDGGFKLQPGRYLLRGHAAAGQNGVDFYSYLYSLTNSAIVADGSYGTSAAIGDGFALVTMNSLLSAMLNITEETEYQYRQSYRYFYELDKNRQAGGVNNLGLPMIYAQLEIQRIG